ncbi:response regulator [Steroidobacter cummioxidans]|uniref:response regulator n=1 Tax=Steroidobacter cummioxidans TaxID=1803913 RepID=UPI0012905EFC|nr:response regulator [Steroidobacter cummioxidans]
MSAVVLLIDDDLRIRNSLGRLLRVLSYDVVEAADWDAALELAAGQRPDVVVTDLHMPEHSGVDIARLLRSHPEFSDIPIIALTATPPRDDETISLFHTVLEKPCAAEDLKRALTDALQTRKH